MKKHLSLLAALACITVLLVSCNQNNSDLDNDGIVNPVTTINEEETNHIAEKEEHRRMVMVKGELYIDTGKESDLGPRCGVMDGEISLTIEETKIPTRNNQSNFGSGYGYQYVFNNSIDVYMNQKWIRFEKKIEDDLGVRLTARDISPTGITLACSQFGGNPTGDLQTGSRFWLEVKDNSQWNTVKSLSPDNQIFWTSEAWIINENDYTKWEEDWTNLYGKLPDGEYRIGKEIMDFRATGDYDEKIYYAEFEIVQ